MKLFVSYSLRNGTISIGILKELRRRLSGISQVYIHALQSADQQEKVLDHLKHSDYMLLLDRQGSESSPWVQKEIQEAEKCGIGIIEARENEISSIDAEWISVRIEQ